MRRLALITAGMLAVLTLANGIRQNNGDVIVTLTVSYDNNIINTVKFDCFV